MTMQTVSLNKAHGGMQGVYKHAEPRNQDRHDLLGVMCRRTGRRQAAGGLVSVRPDLHPRQRHRERRISPRLRRTRIDLRRARHQPARRRRARRSRGSYDFGLGAGFYVDATQQPFAANYRMWSYVTEELPELVAANFPVDPKRQSVIGHSMGGHGALTVALRNPDRYRAASAFSPIVAPSLVPWGIKALGGYLGDDKRPGASTTRSR